MAETESVDLLRSKARWKARVVELFHFLPLESGLGAVEVEAMLAEAHSVHSLP